MTPSTEAQGALLTLSNTLADIVEQIGSSVVALSRRRRRSASGVYWRSGIVVTTEQALHRGDEDLTVTLPDDRTVTASVIGRDPGTDLAVLRLHDSEADLGSLAIASIGDAAALKVGHLVMAIGRSTDSGISASLGVISALGGGWRSWHGGRIDQFIRPSLTLYHGFSGGPLVDGTGRVVGLNTSGPHHMALTIPAATINRVVDQLVQGGRIARGYLGLGMQAVQLPEALQRSLNLAESGGVIVVSVESGAPADNAGVLIGDVLVAIDSVPLQEVGDVHEILDSDSVGKLVTAQIVRGGTVIDLPITIGERPAQEV